MWGIGEGWRWENGGKLVENGKRCGVVGSDVMVGGKWWVESGWKVVRLG